MKQSFFPLLLFPLSVAAQNFSEVDKIALNAPTSKTASVKTLAQYLCAEQRSEASKARAIYAWVTLNIRYEDDTDEREMWATPEHLERQRPEQVLKNKAAVCQGYANLFCALATEAGLPCEVVTGLVKNADDVLEQVGHAWVVARIGTEWRLFDPTWGAPTPGISRWQVVDKYFMADPAVFVTRHLPDDPLWQLLENPVSERRFRDSSAEELLEFAQEKKRHNEFNYRDTLTQWLTLAPNHRLLASEDRVLRFNGSNQRVIFGLGQAYWGLFFDLQARLDSLSDAAVLTDTIALDTLWFDAQIEQMNRYHERARTMFERLEDEERIAKAEKFYSPKDVTALLEKMRGDLHAATFGYMLRQTAAQSLREAQLAALRYQKNQLVQQYALAERTMDCRKMPGACFEISHNRSLLNVQLSQRLVRRAQELANSSAAAKHQRSIRETLAEARGCLLQALNDCEIMRSRPPKFQFVDERVSTIRQSLFTLRSCEVRAEYSVCATDVEEVLNAQKLPVSKAENLVAKMARVGRGINALKDSLETLRRELGQEFSEIEAYNLSLESFALRFNLAHLRYRLVVQERQEAIQKNAFDARRESLRSNARTAQQDLRESQSALDLLEDSKRLSAGSVNQKQQQIGRLSKALRELLDAL